MKSSLDSSLVLPRPRVALLSIAVAFLMGVLFLGGPVTSSKAEWFCYNTWLDRYGQPADNCGGPFNYLSVVGVYAREHSACVSTTTNGNKSGLNRSWLCTSGPWQSIYLPAGYYAAPIIRNNTINAHNHADGIYATCSPADC